MISTSERHAEHPFAGQNTQQLTITDWICAERTRSILSILSCLFIQGIMFATIAKRYLPLPPKTFFLCHTCLLPPRVWLYSSPVSVGSTNSFILIYRPRKLFLFLVRINYLPHRGLNSHCHVCGPTCYQSSHHYLVAV